ncbi:MAG TPA: C39 family peptidase [Actinocatenispora sp.]
MTRTVRALLPLLAAGLAATTLAAPALAAPGATPERGPTTVADWKAAHDTDPHVPLSAAARAALDRRTEAARRHMAARPEATSRTLRGTQQAQQTSYWCGPAAVSGALAVRGVSLSQTGTANLLRTTTDGTDWSGTNAGVPKAYQTGYPVADVLSYKLHAAGAKYHPVGLSYDPTAKEKSAYRTRLVTDVDNGWDMVGDAWEAPGGPHLVGHPGNQEIFHWFTIRGYSSSGAYTQYQDSVHGASSISWASGVPAYSTMSSDTITTINGGRGYVW